LQTLPDERDAYETPGTTAGNVAGFAGMAGKPGARVVIINAEPTAMDDLGDAVLMGDIELLLPQLIVQSEN
jgi:NAD-dependent SIR2 family protein deacetylase